MGVRISPTAVYEPVEDGRVQARIEELPAVITAGPSHDEAKELLIDALREDLLSLGDATSSGPDGGSVTREQLDVVLGA